MHSAALTGSVPSPSFPCYPSQVPGTADSLPELAETENCCKVRETKLSQGQKVNPLRLAPHTAQLCKYGPSVQISNTVISKQQEKLGLGQGRPGKHIPQHHLQQGRATGAERCQWVTRRCSKRCEGN